MPVCCESSQDFVFRACKGEGSKRKSNGLLEGGTLHPLWLNGKPTSTCVKVQWTGLTSMAICGQSALAFVESRPGTNLIARLTKTLIFCTSFSRSTIGIVGRVMRKENIYYRIKILGIWCPRPELTLPASKIALWLSCETTVVDYFRPATGNAGSVNDMVLFDKNT